ncbi:histidine phosphatase family protein [Leucothrix sargassi]|nr:histidine phosphatase family protein [Leucothrix sargassi]
MKEIQKMTTKLSNNKTLYLLRHAKSDWSDRTLSDFERPLNTRGAVQLPQIAKALTTKDNCPKAVISSPASRALSTAKFVAAQIGITENEIGSEKRVYEANILTLLYLLQETSNEIDCLLLVGHNPGMSGLVNTLSKQKIAPIPTGALIQLSLEIDAWEDIEAECASLISVDVPTKES